MQDEGQVPAKEEIAKLSPVESIRPSRLSANLESKGWQAIQHRAVVQLFEGYRKNTVKALPAWLLRAHTSF